MTFRRELRTILDVAVPVIIAELGWMFMGVVDTIMVGPLGAVAIGAVSIGGILFDTLAICGIGVLLGQGRREQHPGVGVSRAGEQLVAGERTVRPDQQV